MGVQHFARRPFFQLEPPQPLRIAGKRSRQNLDCDVSREPRIARAIHLSHSAGAKRREYFVGTESGAFERVISSSQRQSR